MKIAKVSVKGNPCWIREHEGAYYVLGNNSTGEGLHYPDPSREDDFTALDTLEQLDTTAMAEIEFLDPYCGRNIFGLAYNYKSLVGKKDVYDEPLIFLKSANSSCAHGSTVFIPEGIDTVWVEVELVIIIGKKCRKVPVSEASDHIYGFTVGSDMTAKNIARRDHHLARSKALDGFAPVGPWIVTEPESYAMDLTTYINGQQFQEGNTSDRILNDAECVSLLSQFYTLYPGDLIFTGTPAGAMDSLVKPGDIVTHGIDGIGELAFSIG